MEARKGDEAADEDRIAMHEDKHAIVPDAQHACHDDEIDEAHQACRDLAPKEVAEIAENLPQPVIGWSRIGGWDGVGRRLGAGCGRSSHRCALAISWGKCTTVGPTKSSMNAV